MARKRLAEPALKSWAEAENTLREIGVLQRDLSLLETDFKERLEAVTMTMKDQIEPLQAEIDRHESALQAFCEANRTEFVDPRTKAFSYGSVGFRRSTNLVVRNAANTLESLEKLKLVQYIITTKRLNRELMKEEMSDDALAIVGAVRQKQDVFWYETDFGTES